tara:strand:+ start:826 stop:1299 length:474 start_codon:yes stop_codon:yes gene_type:complete
MAKYLLFQNNEFYRMASDETKKDKWIVTPQIVAKEVNDTDYKNVGCKKVTPTLSGDTITYEGETYFNFTDTEPSEPKDLDATESQAMVTWARDTLIKEIKEMSAHNYPTDSAAKAMVAFLEAIDMNAVTSLGRSDSAFEYIYNLSGCPQLYPLELNY